MPIGTTTASTPCLSNHGLKISGDLKVWVGYPMCAMSTVDPLIIVVSSSVVGPTPGVLDGVDHSTCRDDDSRSVAGQQCPSPRPHSRTLDPFQIVDRVDVVADAAVRRELEFG